MNDVEIKGKVCTVVDVAEAEARIKELEKKNAELVLALIGGGGRDG
jgi:hypothetical protein